MKLASGRPAKALLLLTLLLLVLPFIANAYLDPGTGSYVVQLLIGSLLGGLFALGVFWRRVVASFKRFLRRRSSDDGGRS